MRVITIVCHPDGDVWWADARALPGFYATAPTLVELREEVRRGVEFALDGESVALTFVDENGSPLDRFSVL